MNTINGLPLIQKGQVYDIFTPTGAQIARIYTGTDGQIMQDMKALDIITKALAKRFGISK